MTWVPEKSAQGFVDKPFKHYNRTNAGSPQNSVTPQYAGERILDTTNGKQYQALGPTNSTWVEAVVEGSE